MKQVIVNMFSGLGPVCVRLRDEARTGELKALLASYVPVEQQCLSCGSRRLGEDELVFGEKEAVAFVRLSLQILGGKGGFGSQLKAKGAAMGRYIVFSHMP